MDITNFMSWFVGECVRIFTYVYQTLDSITFAGTSILRVIIAISILTAIIPVILTIPRREKVIVSVREQKQEENNKNERKDMNWLRPGK